MRISLTTLTFYGTVCTYLKSNFDALAVHRRIDAPVLLDESTDLRTVTVGSPTALTKTLTVYRISVFSSQNIIFKRICPCRGGRFSLGICFGF